MERHLEVVPESRVSSVTTGPRVMMAAEERQSHRFRQDPWKRPRDPHWKLWIEHPNSRRRQGEVNQPGSTDDLLCSGPVSKEKKQIKGRGKNKGSIRKKSGRPEWATTRVPGVVGWEISLTASFPTMDCASADRKPSLAGSKDGASLGKLTVRSTPTKRLSNILGT